MNCDMKSIVDFTEKMQNRREDYRKCKQICKNFPHESHHKPKEGILSWQPPGAVHTRHSSADHCGLWSWGSTACSPGLAKLQWQKRPQWVNDLVPTARVLEDQPATNVSEKLSSAMAKRRYYSKYFTAVLIWFLFKMQLQLASACRAGQAGLRAELRLHLRSGYISPLYFLQFWRASFCRLNDSFPPL